MIYTQKVGHFQWRHEVYDIHNWKQLVKRQIFCPIHDIICIHDSFLISIESNISPFLNDQLDLEATIYDLEREKKTSKSHILSQESIHKSSESIKKHEQFDLQNELDNMYSQPGQYGNRYYREFNLKQLLPDKFPEYEKNSRIFYNTNSWRFYFYDNK